VADLRALIRCGTDLDAGNVPVIVGDYAEAESLPSEPNENERLDPARAVEVAAAVLAALGHAHAATDGKHVAAAFMDDADGSKRPVGIRVWDVHSRRLVTTLEETFDGDQDTLYANAVVYSPDGRLMVGGVGADGLQAPHARRAGPALGRGNAPADEVARR
jgi:hypothetical protein